jgi:type III HopA1-like effector protein
MSTRRELTAFDDVVRRVRFRSSTSYSIDGEIVEQTPSDATRPATGDSSPAIVRQLQHHIYERCYLERTTTAAAPTGPLTDETPALASANVHVDRWDPGWTITRINADGSVLVAREGKSRMVWGGEYHSTLIGTPPFEGAVVRLFVPHESSAMQPGFYFAFGDVLGDQLEELGMVRLYWNAGAATAPELLNELVSRLRHYRVPFRLKALSAREFYPRPDAFVVYVTQRYLPITFRVARAVHASLSGKLGERAPLFTKTLARGIGFAEDPGNGESFGMSRCRVAAEGLWNAHVTNARDEIGVHEVVDAYARRSGLDPARPWLNPGSTDVYDWDQG